VSYANLCSALLIFGSALVLEDLAVLSAALLALNRTVSLPWAAGSSFAGIWFGDLGLYWLALRYGRPVLDVPWLKHILGKKVDLNRSERWFQSHGVAAIVVSRVIPGTRLPTYLAAGLLKVPAASFLTITAAACAIWVAVLFTLSYQFGTTVVSRFELFRSDAALLTTVLAAGVLIWKLVQRIECKKLLRWEFWPAGVFYVPVAIKYLLLAIKYRSFALPTLANPGMYTGGMIGESKFETLSAMARVYPNLVPETQFVQPENAEHYIGLLDYPVVFKPDVGQRGFGFKIVRSADEARFYFKHFAHNTLIQKYVPGPFEAGIFYYRFPGESHGRIFAITEKIFPVIVGDGMHTLEELILRDPRAELVADTYLTRFAADRARVLEAGESFRLVEAGNHCQGAIFLDGERLRSVELEKRIDAISKAIPGFFVGRYDIRYASEDAICAGEEFQIIELNGASSEATAIYDPRNSLWCAYRTLFRQWEIVFAIGNENRRRGMSVTSLTTIWRNWIRYQRQVALQPLSD